MSHRIFRIYDLLDINDDYINRRGIVVEDRAGRNVEEFTPTGVNDDDFTLLRNEDKPKQLKQINKFIVKVERDNSGDSIKAPNKFMPDVPMGLYILGLVKSGKTTLLNALLDVYKDVFDSIVIISPTIDLDPEMKLIIEKYDIKHTYNSLRIVEKIMKEAKETNKNKRPKDKIKTLIVMDDVINEMIKFCKKEDNFLNKLATNRRHYGISFILLSQYYKRCPPILRTNFSGFCIFRIENQAERKKVVEELSGFLGKKLFEEVFDRATNEPFSFLSINFDAPTKDLIYTKNFNEIILKKSEITIGFADK